MAEFDVTNKKGYLAEAVTQRSFAKENVLIYLVKLTKKHLCRGFFLGRRHETLLK